MNSRFKRIWHELTITVPLIPFAVLTIGWTIPFLFTDYDEDSLQGKLYIGSFIPFVIIVYALFKYIGHKYPTLGKWFGGSTLGELVSLFLGSLCVSLFSLLLTFPTFPDWLHISLAAVICILAFILLLAEASS